MRRKLPVLVVVGLLLPITAPAAGTVVRFAPSSMNDGPFPTDFLTVPDLLQKTGLRPNLPLPDCESQPSTCQELSQLNQLDGFSLLPRVRLGFSAPVNRFTLKGGIFLVWLDNLTGEEPGLHPGGYVSGVNQLVHDPSTNTAFAESDEVLDQHRRYLLVVTDAVLDLASDPVGPDPDFTACITPPHPNAYCSQLASALSQASVPGNVVGASLFTTMSATSWLERARDVIQSTPTSVQLESPANTFRISELFSITLRSQVKVSPPEFSDFTLPAPILFLPEVDRVVFGSYTSPNFLDAGQTIPATPTAVTVALPQESTKISFHTLLPKTAKPASGYPVAIFGHGLNDSRFGAPTLVANGLAKEGFATIAINAVGHGSGPQSTIDLFGFQGLTTLTAGGRSVDLNGDNSIDSREGCLIITPVAVGLRDCIRQTVIDLAQLVRAIRAGIDLDDDGSPDLDGNRIYYSGQSLGGLYGTVLTALEPDVRAAALNVGGGSVTDVGRWSPEFRFLVKDYLEARTPPLLNAGADFDEDYVLRDQPVKVADVPGAVEIQNVLELIEWFQQSGDPTAYAPHLKRSPLAGVPPKPVLWQFARGDRTVPNPQNSALIRGADMRGSSQLYRHDLARQEAPNLSENPHGYLVDITSAAGLLIAKAAQDQIAGFFATGGAAIRNANVLVRSFFSNDIFETPARLPEDPGFSTGLTTVSAASYDGTAVAPESIASIFGEKMATGTEEAVSLPLPFSLAGTTVRVKDSAGTERNAPLFYASPTQINFLIPAGAAPGTATVIVSTADQLTISGAVAIAPVAPSLFSANWSGQGVAAAVAVHVAADQSQTIQDVFDCPGGPGTCSAEPIDFGSEDAQVHLMLFGTGLRAAGGASAVSVKVGGVSVPVTFAGAQEQYVGLDQVNAGPLPRTLLGRGEVPIVMVVDGQPSNIVSVSIR